MNQAIGSRPKVARRLRDLTTAVVCLALFILAYHLVLTWFGFAMMYDDTPRATVPACADATLRISGILLAGAVLVLVTILSLTTRRFFRRGIVYAQPVILFIATALALCLAEVLGLKNGKLLMSEPLFNLLQATIQSVSGC